MSKSKGYFPMPVWRMAHTHTLLLRAWYIIKVPLEASSTRRMVCSTPCIYYASTYKIFSGTQVHMGTELSKSYTQKMYNRCTPGSNLDVMRGLAEITQNEDKKGSGFYHTSS